jgi:lysophospholipase L1-like esterase
MPATATGRGAQVILDGDAQKAARGAYAPTYGGNAARLADLQRSGAVADGLSPDGTTRTGGGAEDYLVDPVSGNALATITRNAAVTRYNNPRVNTVMSPAPTITTSLTHDATLTTAYGWNGGPGGASVYDPPNGTGPFNYSGGVPRTSGFGGVEMVAATYDTGSFRTNVTARLETVVDAIKVEFQFWCFQAAARFRVIVDGQYVSLAETTPASVNNTSYVVLDFTAAGGRKIRRVAIESYQIIYGSVMTVGPTATMQKPGGVARKMCVISDSWGVGNASTILNCFPQVLGDYLGIANVENNGVPATGYLANNGGANLTARQRIVPDVVPFAPDILLITMGFNDATSNTTALQALQNEVALTLQTIRQQPVLANIAIIVCPFGGNHSNVVSYPTEAAIQAGVTASGSPFTYFIPTVNGPNGAWMTGTGNTSAPAGNGNCDIYISSDGTHPNDAGHAYLASRLYDEIMRLAL